MIAIKVTEGARQDVDDGYWFYEEQEVGLGGYFAEHLQHDIQSLTRTAGIHPVVYRETYRFFSNRFPFAIYYRFNEEVATVIGVVDCRRDPDWVNLHLRNRL